MSVRIGIIGHFLLVREALRDLLTKRPGLAVVGEADCGMEAVRQAESWNADLLILYLLQDRFSGQLMVRELKKRIPKIKVLVISPTADGDHILDLLKAGAAGFCRNDDGFAEVFSAIQHLLSGRYYLTALAADQFVRTMLAQRKTISRNGTHPALSPRENDILKLISAGYRTKQIAGHLCLSKRTVEKHRYNIMRKLNIHRTSALVLYERGKTDRP
jgi:two-component system, NarL family, response regulator NreC